MKCLLIAVAALVATAAQSENVQQSPVRVTDTFFVIKEANRKAGIRRPRIELVPTFKNEGSKTAIAFETVVSVSDAFGDQILEVSAKFNSRIASGETNGDIPYLLWEDNQYIRDEPFDRLIAPVKSGTAKAAVKVTRILFDDGTKACRIQPDSVFPFVVICDSLCPWKEKDHGQAASDRVA